MTNLATFRGVIGDFSGIVEPDMKARIVPPQFLFSVSSVRCRKPPPLRVVIDERGSVGQLQTLNTQRPANESLAPFLT